MPSECPPGNPIILLKSNNFNMAAVFVKRSIQGLSQMESLLISHLPLPQQQARKFCATLYNNVLQFVKLI